jgi:class 3 adenylate cyclase
MYLRYPGRSLYSRLEIRAGVHSGQVQMSDDNVSGLAVHIGARVAALAQPGEVLVSQTVKDLVAGSKLTFSDLGPHDLNGMPGRWTRCRVEPEAWEPAHPGCTRPCHWR